MQVTGKRILDFFPQLPTLPKESNTVWPPVLVVEWVRQEARATQNWSKIIEFSWPLWPGTKASLDTYAPVNKMPEITQSDAIRDDIWRRLQPMLEACLHTKDFDKATEIYFELASRPLFEREAKVAFDMAKAHNYTFPPAPRREGSGPGAEVQSFIGDPIVGNEIRIRSRNVGNSLDRLAPGAPHALRLIIIFPTSTPNFVESLSNFNNDLGRILAQGKLSEYELPKYVAPSNQPEAKELIERERLPNNTVLWGLLDSEAKYHHGGNSRPTADNITDLLSSMKRKSRLDIFRDFAKENPESVTAKVHVLREINRISAIRANNAQKDASGNLDGAADMEIWGEFINIANSIIPQILLRPDDIISSRSNPFNIQTINNSQLLKQFAMRHIGAIENALQGRPHTRGLWDLWGTFSPYAPNRSLLALLSTMTPVPDLPDFPPVSLGPELIRSYKSLEAWGSIIALAEPMWEIYENMIKAGENIKHRLTQQLWEQYIAPLCEAYNKLGQEQKAEKIRADWKKAEGWSR